VISICQYLPSDINMSVITMLLVKLWFLVSVWSEECQFQCKLSMMVGKCYNQVQYNMGRFYLLLTCMMMEYCWTLDTCNNLKIINIQSPKGSINGQGTVPPNNPLLPNYNQFSGNGTGNIQLDVNFIFLV
jgi:hypothetical protein